MPDNCFTFSSANAFIEFLSENEGLYKHFPEYQILIKVWNSAQRSSNCCGSSKETRLQLLERMYQASIPATPKESIEKIKKYMIPLTNKSSIKFCTKIDNVKRELLTIESNGQHT